MVEKPILFSTPMVQAILEGRKTQTRRIIKSRHESGLFRISRRMTDNVITSIESLDWDERNCEKDITCPYGKTGDEIWVKETFTVLDYWDNQKTVQVMYEDAKTALCTLTEKEWAKFEKWKEKTVKKPSLFMFKSMSRIFLEITDIRVERLQEISEEDAIAEGILKDEMGFKNYDKKLAEQYGHPDYDWPHLISPIDSFKSLWQSINGEQSWKENPWVWVLEFRIKELKK